MRLGAGHISLMLPLLLGSLGGPVLSQDQEVEIAGGVSQMPVSYTHLTLPTSIQV